MCSVSLPFTIVKNNYNKLRGLPDNLFPPLLTVMGNLSQNKHSLGLSFVFLDPALRHSASPEVQQLFKLCSYLFVCFVLNLCVHPLYVCHETCT